MSTAPDGRGRLLQLRRDTTTDWEAVDPILAAGEPGVVFDPDTGATIGMVLGDGETEFTGLRLFTPAGGSGQLEDVTVTVAWDDLDIVETPFIMTLDITGEPTGGTFDIHYDNGVGWDLAPDWDVTTVELQALIDAEGGPLTPMFTVTGENPNFVITANPGLITETQGTLTSPGNALTGGTDPDAVITVTQMWAQSYNEPIPLYQPLEGDWLLDQSFDPIATWDSSSIDIGSFLETVEDEEPTPGNAGVWGSIDAAFDASSIAPRQYVSGLGMGDSTVLSLNALAQSSTADPAPAPFASLAPWYICVGSGDWHGQAYGDEVGETTVHLFVLHAGAE